MNQPKCLFTEIEPLGLRTTKPTTQNQMVNLPNTKAYKSKEIKRPPNGRRRAIESQKQKVNSGAPSRCLGPWCVRIHPANARLLGDRHDATWAVVKQLLLIAYHQKTQPIQHSSQYIMIHPWEQHAALWGILRWAWWAEQRVVPNHCRCKIETEWLKANGPIQKCRGFTSM